MNTYLAESVKNGVEFSHAYSAETWEEAQQIAEYMGYSFVGQYDDDETIELMLCSQKLH